MSLTLLSEAVLKPISRVDRSLSVRELMRKFGISEASEIPNLRISSRTERERSTRLIGLSTASLNNVKDIFKAHVTRHHDVYNRRGKHHQSGWDVDRIAQRLSGHILGGLIGV